MLWRASRDFYHLNSVYRHDDLLYLMAHNHSVKTGRYSEILVYDTEFKFVETIKTGGRCCHNVFFDNRELLYCRSLEMTLAYGTDDVFTAR